MHTYVRKYVTVNDLVAQGRCLKESNRLVQRETSQHMDLLYARHNRQPHSWRICSFLQHYLQEMQWACTHCIVRIWTNNQYIVSMVTLSLMIPALAIEVGHFYICQQRFSYCFHWQSCTAQVSNDKCSVRKAHAGTKLTSKKGLVSADFAYTPNSC